MSSCVWQLQKHFEKLKMGLVIVAYSVPYLTPFIVPVFDSNTTFACGSPSFSPRRTKFSSDMLSHSVACLNCSLK